MDNYTVTFVFDYCTITASANASDEVSAIDIAWDWVADSGIVGDRSIAIDILVEETG